MYQEMKISLFSPVVSIMDTTASTANTIRMYELGMSEIEIYTRQEQYVPGSMVRSKLKNENVVIVSIVCHYNSCNYRCCAFFLTWFLF